jgi:hypothetical protein
MQKEFVMNPLIAHLYAQCSREPVLERPTPPRAPDAAQQRATAYDRHYITTHAQNLETLRNVMIFDRPPLPEEWREVLPCGAFVRVFVINERTTVRVLHTATEQRMGEPVIDTWCGEEDATIAQWS